MSKGEDTKYGILENGLSIASQYGLGDVTIGGLAKDMKMSKSGIFGHFNSKENLQLQIIQYAADQFVEDVIKPTLKVERGIPRILAMIEYWKSWSEQLIGGCLFVSAGNEFSDRPGAVQDALVKHQKMWLESIEKLAVSAIKCGDFRSDIDTAQFAFELYSLILGFHYYHRMLKDTETQKRQSEALNKLINNYTY